MPKVLNTDKNRPVFFEQRIKQKIGKKDYCENKKSLKLFLEIAKLEDDFEILSIEDSKKVKINISLFNLLSSKTNTNIDTKTEEIDLSGASNPDKMEHLS
jgi:hypothetical protein